ncbi:uncharacterized protein MYCGRDRAFT_82218 [Zymoseptoria tritici IPO323]|uniref:Uncharacterized protein n=1 Tax=Zymoseptoria tritici (strain CBS 115943 / IPO323) TaxID=336722 RepID=F9XK63_ZYMTI|nr:uncharacterized protein MYCGRDRAFT_82218 [Zymoseptoria tritici IPO323]EGP84570.1 hypothetical protein MYCGRDRAFT_82218 [Zymoseptoria tritici IPO323]
MEDFPFHQNHMRGTESGFELTENEFGRPTLVRIDSDWSPLLSDTADFLTTAAGRVLRQRIEKRRPLLPEDLGGVDLSVLSKSTLESIYRDHFTATEKLQDCKEMNNMLKAFDTQTTEKYGILRPYIHPKTLCCVTDQERVNWASAYDDVADTDIFSAFSKTPKTRSSEDDEHTAKTWIAIVKSPQVNWVNNPRWKDFPWHLWAFAIVGGPTAHGKYLFIYDCDSGPLLERHQTVKLKDLHGSIVKWYKLIIKRWQIKKVFMGNIHDDFISDTMEYKQYSDTSIEVDENHCIGHTMRWVHKMSWIKDKPFEEEDLKEPRWESFVEMEYLSKNYT